MRRQARAALIFGVRGRRTRGGPWGEAAARRVSTRSTGRLGGGPLGRAGACATVWHERRAMVRTLPIRVRVERAVIGAALLAVPGGARRQPVRADRPALHRRARLNAADRSQIQDRFLLDKVTFRLTGLQRGDIVEFSTAQTADRNVLKRVIGLPGDTIECRAGTVYPRRQSPGRAVPGDPRRDERLRRTAHRPGRRRVRPG